MVEQIKMLSVDKALSQRLQFLIDIPGTCDFNNFSNLVIEILVTPDCIKNLINTMRDDPILRYKCEKLDKFHDQLMNYLLQNDFSDSLISYRCFFNSDRWKKIRDSARNIVKNLL